MGKVQKFTIAFDQNKDVYTPGDSITGTVSITAGPGLVCKVIKVNCNGFCGITNKVNDTDWILEEQYFNSSVSLADKGTLKEGEHTFPFKFLIPATAPTSFEGKYGKIVYRLRAFIDTPRFAKDYNTEKPFYLLRLLNLNEIPDIWEASESAVTQQFTYMLMKTGTVVLKAQTDFKGYTPGQNIQLTANIHNQSGKSTGNITASLVQRVTYETKKPTHDLRTIAEVQGGAVKGGKEIEWKDQIIIPSLPQSWQSGCDLIKIEYFVQVSLKSPDVLLTLPIYIGNVSLDNKKRPPKTAEVQSSAPVESPTPNPSATTLTLPPRSAPKPAPRPTPRTRTSSHISPSAPPADYLQGAEGRSPAGDEYPNKRQSQLVSPNAFSYAPGLLFPNNPQSNRPTANASSGPANDLLGATQLYPALNSMPQPLNVPPNYENSSFPQEAPPSYDESCNT